MTLSRMNVNRQSLANLSGDLTPTRRDQPLFGRAESVAAETTVLRTCVQLIELESNAAISSIQERSLAAPHLPVPLLAGRP